jgi:predicted transcriptional regulator
MQRFSSQIRRPVRRQGAEQYLLVTLLSFAGAVTVTRLFLALTGYPQLGGGDLHIAHALWGGLLLFIAALFPLMFANRWAYLVNAALAGVGVGLFIDEVGKFMTRTNNYFYPLAAPIVYGFFLATVMLYLSIRRSRTLSVREELYRVFDAMQEVLDQDLEPQERDALEARLHYVADNTERPDLAQLANALLEFLRCEALTLAEQRTGMMEKSLRRLRGLEERRLTRRRFKAVLVLGLVLLAVGTLVKSTVGLALVALPAQGAAAPGSFAATILGVAQALAISVPDGLFRMTDLGLETAIGLMFICAAVLMTTRREQLGTALGSLGLLLSLTGVNLLSFYYDQFGGIASALFQLAVLIGLAYYRQRYVTRDMAARHATPIPAPAPAKT